MDHANLDNLPSEIIIQIFEDLPSVHDALRLSQTSHRTSSIWTGHSDALVPLFVQKTVQSTAQADALARLQQICENCTAIDYLKKVLKIEYLSQQALKEFESQVIKVEKDRVTRYKPDCPLSEDERLDFMTAFYHVLLTTFCNLLHDHSAANLHRVVLAFSV